MTGRTFSTKAYDARYFATDEGVYPEPIEDEQRVYPECCPFCGAPLAEDGCSNGLCEAVG